MAICHGELGSRYPLGRKLAWVTATSWPVPGFQVLANFSSREPVSPTSQQHLPGAFQPETKDLSPKPQRGWRR